MIPCEFSQPPTDDSSKKYLKQARECTLKASDKFKRFCWMYAKPKAVRECVHRLRETQK